MEPVNAIDLRRGIKLDCLLKEARDVLQAEFQRRWKQLTNSDWTNSVDLSRKEFIHGLGSEVYKKTGRIQRASLEEGNINKLDITTIAQLLQTKKMTQQHVDKTIKTSIQDIVNVRNKMAHHPNKCLSQDEFNELWSKLSEALITFGFRQDALDEIFLAEEIGGINFSKNSKKPNDKSMIEGTKLKEQGNKLFSQGKFHEAIEVYTRAISVPDLSDDILAILYSNRSATYLKLKKSEDNIQNAVDDAKRAVSAKPQWWKSHFRTGCAYEEKKKFPKALRCYTQAYALDPTQEEVRSAMQSCRQDLKIRERQEHLDPNMCPRSREESLGKIRDRLGAPGLTLKKMSKMMKEFRKSGDPTLIAKADVYFAHHYLTGMDDVPQNYEQAAKLFAKAAAAGNAEAIYNLAILTKSGDGVDKNIPAAIRLLRQAASHPPFLDKSKSVRNVGVAEAEHSLGLCYQDGVGVEANYAMALSWYEKGSEHGCHGSTNNLGHMYADGTGVVRNLKRAEQYWKFAASRGNVNAMQSLVTHYLREDDVAQAKLWLKCAQDNGSLVSGEYVDIFAEAEKEIQKKLKPVKKWERAHGLTAGNLSVQARFSRMMESELEPEACQLLEETKTYWERHALDGEVINRLPSGGKSAFSEELDYRMLTRKAEDGSITARRLKLATEQYRIAMELLLEQRCPSNEILFQHLAEAIRTEHIVVKFAERLKDVLLELVYGELNPIIRNAPSAYECDLRVCLIQLKLNSLEENLMFIAESLKRFPEEVHFYYMQAGTLGFLRRYKEALKGSTRAILKFPTNVDLLYLIAVHTRLIESSSISNSRDVIKAYEEFLRVAPRDERKVPEAYYCLALESTHMALEDKSNDEIMEALEKYYFLGLEAEKNQLPCFLPYDSDSKILVERMYKMMRLGSKGKIKKSPKRETKVEQKQAKNLSIVLDPIRLKDPFRRELIINHREMIKQLNLASSTGQHLVKTTNPPKNKQQAPMKLADLKSITLREIDITKDHVYNGRVLQLRSLDDANLGISSIQLIVEDENGDVQRCFVYNFPKEENVQEKLGFGSEFSILNPYMRMAADFKPSIRVDDPKSIIVHSMTGKKNCRTCLKENAGYACSRCKRASYCSQACQTNDWKVLKHKYICGLISDP